MKLGMRKGKVVWLKADGTPSEMGVSIKKTIVFYGFPEAPGETIKVLDGDPLKNEIILVKASGTSWWGTLLLSKSTGEWVEIEREDTEYAKELVNEPPQGEYSLEDIIEERKNKREQERRRKRDAVDIKVLAQERDLAVWEGNSFDGYWCKKYGEFNGMPDDWSILPKGDGVLTRTVRKGPYWILMKKRPDYSEVIGTIAPTENIERAFIELGGEDGAINRQKGKEEGQYKREKILTKRLEAAIIRSFPNIPEEDLSTVLKTSRSEGAVGTAQWLYFSTVGSDESFDRAAYLSVRAHVRHQHTNYDEILSNSFQGFYSDEARSDARHNVADKIEEILDKWRQLP